MELDLASLKSVRHFCHQIEKTYAQIDILVNNAGVMVPLGNRMTTHDGFEIHFGVNYASHFLLTNLLLPLLKKAKSSR